jgi:outer membrane protein TolC
LLLPLSLRAEPREIASSLTLDEVVTGALRDNAQLRAMRAKWEAMRERPVQATTRPNPMFRYGGMDMAGDGKWPDTEEKRFMIEQEFPAPGKLGLRGRIAGKDAEMMQRDYEAMQREVVMMAKETYFDLYGVQRSASVLRAEQDVLERMVKIAQTMYATGQRPQQDALKAQAELTMLRQKLIGLEQQEAVLKAKINLLLNRPADAPVGLAATAPPTELEIKPAGTRSEVEKAEAALRRSELERALMRKEFLPDYRLGVEYRSFRSGEDMVMFTVGFDLPIWQTKNRAAVREADKMVEAGKAALEAATRQAAFDVKEARLKWQMARRTLELYRNELIPQAQARFESSEAGYRTGKVDFMDLLESERFLLEARVMAAMAEGEIGIQAARLERAAGLEEMK